MISRKSNLRARRDDELAESSVLTPIQVLMERSQATKQTTSFNQRYHQRTQNSPKSPNSNKGDDRDGNSGPNSEEFSDNEAGQQAQPAEDASFVQNISSYFRGFMEKPSIALNQLAAAREGAVFGAPAAVKTKSADQGRKTVGPDASKMGGLLQEKVNGVEGPPTISKQTSNPVDTNHFSKLLSHIGMWGASSPTPDDEDADDSKGYHSKNW